MPPSSPTNFIRHSIILNSAFIKAWLEAYNAERHSEGSGTKVRFGRRVRGRFVFSVGRRSRWSHYNPYVNTTFTRRSMECVLLRPLSHYISTETKVQWKQSATAETIVHGAHSPQTNSQSSKDTKPATESSRKRREQWIAQSFADAFITIIIVIVITAIENKPFFITPIAVAFSNPFDQTNTDLTIPWLWRHLPLLHKHS